MKCIAFVLTLCCFVTAASAADYRFSREVLGNHGDKPALLTLALDAAVYKASAADFRDLALLDEQNQETAYVLQKIASRKTVSRRIALVSATPELQPNANGGITVIIKLEPFGFPADGLTLATGQRDFEYSVRVEGSLDGSYWYPLVEGAAIYDYSRHMAVSNHNIALPPNRYPILRIVIDRAVQSHIGELTELTRSLRGNQELQRDEKTELRQEALHIDRIEPWRTQTDNVADVEQVFNYPPTTFKISQDAERQATLIDISMDNQPLNGFDVDIATPNFNRRAEVQIPIRQGIETRMQILASGVLEALRFRDIDRLQNHLPFPEQRRNDYRIVINNLDTPPLAVNGIVGTGPGYQLLFIGQPGKRYRLVYGADLDAKPRYDIEPIRELQRRGQATESADLGPEVAALAAEKSWDFAALINSNGFLTGVVVLMVLVLAWSLFKVGKRMNDLDA